MGIIGGTEKNITQNLTLKSSHGHLFGSDGCWNPRHRHRHVHWRPECTYLDQQWIIHYSMNKEQVVHAMWYIIYIVLCRVGAIVDGKMRSMGMWR